MRLTAARRAVAAGVLAAACLPAEVHDFVEARTSALCARHVRCGTLADNAWSDADACEAALGETAASRALNGADECRGFDVAAADACLAAIDEAACDAPPDLSSCEAVCDG